MTAGYIAADQVDQPKSLTLRALTSADLFRKIIGTVGSY